MHIARSNWMTALVARCGCFLRTPGYVRKRRHHASCIKLQGRHGHGGDPLCLDAFSGLRRPLRAPADAANRALHQRADVGRSMPPGSARGRLREGTGSGVGRYVMRAAEAGAVSGAGDAGGTGAMRVRAAVTRETLDPLAGRSPYTKRIYHDVVASWSIRVARGLQRPMSIHGWCCSSR
jgi:hypothetical protein